MDITFGAFSLSISAFTMFILALATCLLVISMRRRARRKHSDDLSVHSVRAINTKNTIATIIVSGPILTDAPKLPSFATQFVTVGATVEKALCDAAKNDNVLGVIVRFSTPGGTIPGSVAIARGISACREKKPVYAHLVEMTASGGVWGMVAAEEIFAEFGTLIGSIGVRGPTILRYDNVTALGGGAAQGLVRA